MSKIADTNTWDTSFRKTLQHVEVVSFDIFGTLIVYPFVDEHDLIVHLGREAKQRLGVHDFAEVRHRAEQQARAGLDDREVPLQKIYDQMDATGGFSAILRESLMHLELALRRDLALPRKTLRQWYEQARQAGKRIVITSDTPLPVGAVEELLKRQGLHGHERLFLSSETGITKKSGKLFAYLVQELGVPPEKILHVGDRKQIDDKQARAHGICSLLIPTPLDLLLSSSLRSSCWKKNMNGIGRGMREIIALGSVRYFDIDKQNIYIDKPFSGNVEIFSYMLMGPLLEWPEITRDIIGTTYEVLWKYHKMLAPEKKLQMDTGINAFREDAALFSTESWRQEIVRGAWMHFPDAAIDLDKHVQNLQLPPSLVERSSRESLLACLWRKMELYWAGITRSATHSFRLRYLPEKFYCLSSHHAVRRLGVLRSNITSAPPSRLQKQEAVVTGTGAVEDLAKREEDAERIGYEILGPFVAQWCRWIYQCQHDIPDAVLLFEARDGALPLEIYKTLFPEQGDKCHYLLTSSLAVQFATITHPQDVLDSLIRHRAWTTVREALMYGGHFANASQSGNEDEISSENALFDACENDSGAHDLGSLHDTLQGLLSDSRMDLSPLSLRGQAFLHKAFDELQELVMWRAVQHRQWMQTKLQEFTKNRMPILVDIGYAGSNLRLASKLLERKVQALYMLSHARPANTKEGKVILHYSAFAGNKLSPQNIDNCLNAHRLVLEAMLSSVTHSTFLHYDPLGNAVFAPRMESDQSRLIRAALHRGARCCARDLHQAGLSSKESQELLLSAEGRMRRFLTQPTPQEARSLLHLQFEHVTLRNGCRDVVYDVNKRHGDCSLWLAGQRALRKCPEKYDGDCGLSEGSSLQYIASRLMNATQVNCFLTSPISFIRDSFYRRIMLKTISPLLRGVFFGK